MRLAELQELVRDAQEVIGSGGAYLKADARCSVANEVVHCLGRTEEGLCVADLSMAHESCDVDDSPLLDSDYEHLMAAVHAVVNFQSSLTEGWYQRVFVPAIGADADLHIDDMEGAAMELLAVIAFASAVATLELGLGSRELSTYEPASTQGSSVQKGSRATDSAKLTRTASIGWAPYVRRSDILKKDNTCTAAAKAAIDLSPMAFDTNLPLKSLSAGSLLDYAFSLKLMATAYVPAHAFMNLRWCRTHRKGLTRAQVEVVAESYSKGRRCNF